MWSWHKDYFQLQTPEAQQIKEVYSDLPFPPESRTSCIKDALPIPGGKEQSYHQRCRVEANEHLYKQSLLKSLLSSFGLPIYFSSFSTIPLSIQPHIETFRPNPFFGSSFSMGAPVSM